MDDPETILNWRRFDDRLTTSGQPSEAQLAKIRDLGVTHVINLGLHTHPRALPDEAATVHDLGMAYINIPVDFDRPTEADFEMFCAAMADLPETPVHVHCIVNARVTAFLYRYRRDWLKADSDGARRLLDSVWRPGGVGRRLSETRRGSLSRRRLPGAITRLRRLGVERDSEGNEGKPLSFLTRDKAWLWRDEMFYDRRWERASSTVS